MGELEPLVLEYKDTSVCLVTSLYDLKSHAS